MFSIIKSVIKEGSEEFKLRYVEELLDCKDLLNPQEVEMLEYVGDSFKSTGRFPTPVLLCKKFPNFEIPLEKESGFDDLKDLEVYFYQVVEKRRRQKVAAELMKLTSEIPEKGISDETAEKIRNLVAVSSKLEVEITAGLGSVLNEYKEAKSKPIGLKTYVKEIDSMIGGVNPGILACIFAWVASFKSTWAVNIAYNNAVKNGYNVAVISLEVPKRDVIYNFLSRHSFDAKFTKYPFVGHDRIRKFKLSPEEEEYLMTQVAPDFDNAEGKVVVLDETDFAGFTFVEIQNALNRVDDLVGGLDAVIWDHANLFKYGKDEGRMSQGEIINKYVSFIRRLGIRFRLDKETGEWRQLSNIILAQANREGWKSAAKNGGRYTLRALSEANELERASAIVASIYTDENMKLNKEAYVQLLKNRFGQTIYDPVQVFVEPEAYVFGEEVLGADMDVNVAMFDQMFDVGNLDLGAINSIDDLGI